MIVYIMQIKDIQSAFRKEKARFGRIHAVMKSGESWIGVADPDWEGNASSPGQQ